MRAYRVHFDASERVLFTKTKREAQKFAKAHYDDDPTIDYVVVKTDADSVIGFMNGVVPEEFEVLATWSLTPRGGLRSVYTLRTWDPPKEALM